MTSALTGRTAFVTGGSRGLGRAICLALAYEGAHVAFNYHRSHAEAEELLVQLKQISGKAWAFPISVLDRPGIQEIAKTLENEAGSVDILINNAGIGQVVPLVMMEEEDWDKMMDTNVKGAFNVTQAFLRGMIKAKKGQILNISSLAGVKMMQAPVHYCAAKAALKGFTEGLAKEVARYGITVNCLAPGVLDEGVSANLPEVKKTEFLKHCALGRVGSVREIADVATFLVSGRNTFMNGATVVVDGGV